MYYLEHIETVAYVTYSYAYLLFQAPTWAETATVWLGTYSYMNTDVSLAALEEQLFLLGGELQGSMRYQLTLRQGVNQSFSQGVNTDGRLTDRQTDRQT
jgi:hypothetical protein